MKIFIILSLALLTTGCSNIRAENASLRTANDAISRTSYYVQQENFYLRSSNMEKDAIISKVMYENAQLKGLIQQVLQNAMKSLMPPPIVQKQPGDTKL